MNTRYRWNRLLEKLQIWVAWRMPRWLVKWCAVRVMTNATQGTHSSQTVPDLTCMDALRSW